MQRFNLSSRLIIKLKNMKKLILSISLILALANMSFASQPLSKFIKQEREVKNYNGVVAGGPIHVIITLGSTEGIRFEGDAEAIATLITEVKESMLIIRPKNSWTSWARVYENKKITAYVSAKTIRSLTMSGNGSITVNGKIKEAGLAASVSGSGSISAGAEVDSFTGVISGSGNLNFSGTANDASIVVSGSGSFTKKGFSVANLSSVISGSGSVNVNVDHNIEAVISGSGSINYGGNATIVEKNITGSGRVRKI